MKQIDRLTTDFRKLTQDFEDNSNKINQYNREIEDNYDLVAACRQEILTKEVEKLAFEVEGDKYKRLYETLKEDFNK